MTSFLNRWRQISPRPFLWRLLPILAFFIWIGFPTGWEWILGALRFGASSPSALALASLETWPGEALPSWLPAPSPAPPLEPPKPSPPKPQPTSNSEPKAGPIQDQGTQSRPAPAPIAEASPKPSSDPAGQPSQPPKMAGLALGSVSQAGKKIALTFDDGPSEAWTAKYLEVLKEYQAPATFFLIGKHSQAHPELVRLIASTAVEVPWCAAAQPTVASSSPAPDQGNAKVLGSQIKSQRVFMEIGAHSWSHQNLRKASPSAIEAELSQTSQLLGRLMRRPVTLFRPPGGNYNQTLIARANQKGQTVVLWNIDPKDWMPSHAQAGHLARHVLAHARPGSIVLLHEGKPATLAALPAIIKGLRSRGYELVTVSELLAANSK